MISILLGSGFEEIEAITVFDVLKRAGADVALVSVTGSIDVNSARNLIVKADELLDDIMDKKQQMVVIPGGMGGVRRILNAPSAKIFLKNIFENKTPIGAICAGPIVLDKFGILPKDTKYTCYPGIEEEIDNGVYVDEKVVVDGQFITSVGPGTADDFAFALVGKLFGEKKKKEIESNWYGIRDEDKL